MNEILSNDEIDSLLDLFQSEGAGVEDAEASHLAMVAGGEDDGPIVKPVDLLKPNRLGREQLLSLERYFKSAARMMSATISDRLRLDVQCDCVAVEQLRFQTWINQLSGPVAIYLLEMKPFDAPVLLTASTSLLYGAVDRILGGSGKLNKVPKDFTSAEFTVADALIGPCLDRICESLGEEIKIQWQVEKRFCNPSMAQVLPAQDVVLSIYYQVAGEFLLGDLRLVIPFSALEPHLLDLGRTTASAHEPGAMKEVVGENLQSVDVGFRVRLGQSTIPLRQLMRLREGDVVLLATRIGDKMTAPVQGVPKFLGQIGTRGNRMAFQVTDVLRS